MDNAAPNEPGPAVTKRPADAPEAEALPRHAAPTEADAPETEPPQEGEAPAEGGDGDAPLPAEAPPDAAAAVAAEGADDERDFLGRRVYKVAVDVYSGPLDLLLFLIKRDEIDIEDIPIAYVAEEYSKFLDMVAEWNINTAGDFLVMAATLMEIKSRMLLPEPPPLEEDEEYEDPRADLVRQLMEYKRYKETAMELGRRAEERARRFAPPGERRPGEEDVPLILGVDVWQLAAAFEEVLASVAGTRPTTSSWTKRRKRSTWGALRRASRRRGACGSTTSSAARATAPCSSACSSPCWSFAASWSSGPNRTKRAGTSGSSSSPSPNAPSR